MGLKVEAVEKGSLADDEGKGSEGTTKGALAADGGASGAVKEGAEGEGATQS